MESGLPSVVLILLLESRSNGSKPTREVLFLCGPTIGAVGPVPKVYSVLLLSSAMVNDDPDLDLERRCDGLSSFDLCEAIMVMVDRFRSSLLFDYFDSGNLIQKF